MSGMINTRDLIEIILFAHGYSIESKMAIKIFNCIAIGFKLKLIKGK